MQGASQLVLEQLGLGALLMDTLTLNWEEPGFELATLRLPADPLYHLSFCRPLYDQKPPPGRPAGVTGGTGFHRYS